MAKEILKDEILSEETLDNVTGGSNAEYGSLFTAISNNSAINGGKKFDYKDVAAIQSILKDKLGIEAEINTNFGFILGPNDPGIMLNKYKDAKTGERLTHMKVLERIGSYN